MNRRTRRRLQRAVRVLPQLVIIIAGASCREQPADQHAAPSQPEKTAAAEANRAASGSTATPVARAPIHFTDVTRESGIDFRLTSGTQPATQLLEVKGGGLALIDFDNDGRLDLFVPNGATLADTDHGPGCRLFRNLGGLRFEDVTARAKLSFQRWGLGVATGDADGDGFDDLFISCFGRNALLRNNGDGTFTELENAGIAHEGWNTGCAWGDLDADGDLDLYVASFLQFDPKNPPPSTTFKGVEVFAGPIGLTPTADALFENLGDGTFRDVTKAAGCDVPPQFGLNIAILDLSGDGKPDIFVGNDSTPNFLFRNKGGMQFDEVAMLAGIAANGEGANQATMGIAIADVNADLLPDVFTTNFSSDTNTLHVNLGGTMFDDRTQLYGLASASVPFLGWATGFYDFNHDGTEDVIAFNGHVYPHATRATMDSDFLQTPLLFTRQGKRFHRVLADEAGPWLDEKHADRSAVFGDLDDDGDIDIIVAELGGPLRVLRNDRDGGAWMTIELLDKRTGCRNHRAIGSIVDVASGEQTQRRWVYSGGSFQSSSALAAHFGFASANAPRTVRITWPDGSSSEFADVKSGAAYIVERSDEDAAIREK